MIIPTITIQRVRKKKKNKKKPDWQRVLKERKRQTHRQRVIKRGQEKKRELERQIMDTSRGSLGEWSSGPGGTPVWR